MRIMQLAAVSDISEQPGGVRPRQVFPAIGRAIEAVIMTLFAVIGWLAGVCWRLSRNSLMSLEYGFRSGAGWPQREPAGDEPEPEG